MACADRGPSGLCRVRDGASAGARAPQTLEESAHTATACRCCRACCTGQISGLRWRDFTVQGTHTYVCSTWFNLASVWVQFFNKSDRTHKREHPGTISCDVSRGAPSPSRPGERRARYSRGTTLHRVVSAECTVRTACIVDCARVIAGRTQPEAAAATQHCQAFTGDGGRT